MSQAQQTFTNDPLTKIQDLPNELYFAIAQFLPLRDLCTLRLVNPRWNEVSTHQLTRANLVMPMERARELAKFNLTFGNPEATDLEFKKIQLKLPLLCTRNCSDVVAEFGQTFGTRIQSLGLNYHHGWGMLSRKQTEGIRRNFQVLMAQVAGTLQELCLTDFSDNFGSTFDWSPEVSFPALRRIKIGYGFGISHLVALAGFLNQNAQATESFVSKLSERVPNISEVMITAAAGSFAFGHLVTQLANGLQNLTVQNPEVAVTLTFGKLLGGAVTWAQIATAMTPIPIRLVSLSVNFDSREGDDLKPMIDWIAAQAPSLRHLSLKDTMNQTPNTGEFPSLPALESLTYSHNNDHSVLSRIWPNRFQNLRKVSTNLYGTDFRGSSELFGNVRELNIMDISNSEDRPDNEAWGNFYNRFFPNIESLEIIPLLLELDFLFEFSKLKNLKVGPIPASEFVEVLDDSDYWQLLTWQTTRLNLAEIQNLTPEAVGDEVKSPAYNNLTELDQLELTLPSPGECATEALIYLHRIGKLQILKKLILNFVYNNYDDEALPENQISQLKGQHNEVKVTEINAFPRQGRRDILSLLDNGLN